MIGSYVTTLPALDRPASGKTVAAPAQLGPPDPARVSPIHLPALHLAASDLDGLDAPVKIVNPTPLDWCDTCAHGDDVPDLDAICTVVGYDPRGFGYRIPSCALHIDGMVRHYRRHGWPTVVEVPTCSAQWFERSDRETYWAVDESRGVAATRGIWDAWQVVEVVNGYGSPKLLASVGLRDGDSFNQSRARAEVLAQAVAAQRAADAYEAGFSETVALPVVAVSEAAA